MKITGIQVELVVGEVVDIWKPIVLKSQRRENHRHGKLQAHKTMEHAYAITSLHMIWWEERWTVHL